MNKIDKQYNELLQDILNNGTEKQDRTGTGTISVFGRQIRHSMREGFPLLTTKKMYFKGIVTELLWFLRGDTNIKYLVDNDCHIWDGDAHKAYLKKYEQNNKTPGFVLYTDPLQYRPYTQEEFINKIETDDEFANKWGDLGPVYGQQWRNVKHTVVVTDITPYKKQPHVLNIIPKFSREKPDFSQNKMEIVGKVYESNSYGKYTVIREYYIGNQLRYDIQFELTGYILRQKTKQVVTKTFEVRDPYYPSIYGVACVGELEVTDVTSKRLRSVWEGMISRCYNPKDIMYYLYGGKGVYVEDRWLVFTNFLKDAPLLEGWELKIQNWDVYTLDKDSKLSNYYGVEKCIWLSKNEQVQLSSRTDFIAIDPSGVESVHTGVKYFCKVNNLNPVNVSNYLNGRQNTTRGWRFRKLDKNKSYIITEQIDQIQNLIDDLRTNPDNRRLLVTAWNPPDVPRQVLPPCHYGFQIYTRELSQSERFDRYSGLTGINMHHDHIEQEMDENNIPKRAISLMWSQRSVDTPLGLPFNIASYGLLLEILGKMTNMFPDELIGNLGDTHIYKNQVEGVETQLIRTPYKLPRLVISDQINFNGDINQFLDSCLISDFQIEDYQSHPVIKFPLSN